VAMLYTICGDVILKGAKISGINLNMIEIYTDEF
jgi:hypothetical protein